MLFKFILVLFMVSCSDSKESPSSVETSSGGESSSSETQASPSSTDSSTVSSSSESSAGSSTAQQVQANAISLPNKISFQEDSWISLNFRGIPQHSITYSPQKMTIEVRSSASPLIYSLESFPSLSQISVKGRVSQLVKVSPSEKQGDENLDDFNLRVGLVLLGENTLRWYQRATAPGWVKQMFDLAPSGQGIDHIYFLNAVLSPQKLNQTRTHPLSEYIREENAWLMNQTGEFSYTHSFETPQKIGALWISVDGDDTQSDFDLDFTEISYR